MAPDNFLCGSCSEGTMVLLRSNSLAAPPGFPWGRGLAILSLSLSELAPVIPECSQVHRNLEWEDLGCEFSYQHSLATWAHKAF